MNREDEMRDIRAALNEWVEADSETESELRWVGYAYVLIAQLDEARRMAAALAPYALHEFVVTAEHGKTVVTRCMQCGQEADAPEEIAHAPDCPVLMAQGWRD